MVLFSSGRLWKSGYVNTILSNAHTILNGYFMVAPVLFILRSFHPTRSYGVDFSFRSEWKSKTGMLPGLPEG